LSYIETRLRNIPNSEGSPARGYFQAFPAFSSEAISASGGIDPRDSDYNKAAKATAAWIRTYNKPAWAAIRAGRYDEADRLLRNTWPSLPGGDQAQASAVQKTARKYLR
jgi:muramidase (phage lysozyme)